MPKDSESKSLRGLQGAVSRQAVILVVDQDAVGGAVEIVKLPVVHRPEECGETQQPQNERRGNENHKSRYHGAPALSLSAFSVTRSDDDAIATAAISGVTRPTIANGMATAL